MRGRKRERSVGRGDGASAAAAAMEVDGEEGIGGPKKSRRSVSVSASRGRGASVAPNASGSVKSRKDPVPVRHTRQHGDLGGAQAAQTGGQGRRRCCSARCSATPRQGRGTTALTPSWSSISIQASARWEQAPSDVKKEDGGKVFLSVVLVLWRMLVAGLRLLLF